MLWMEGTVCCRRGRDKSGRKGDIHAVRVRVGHVININGRNIVICCGWGILNAGEGRWDILRRG